VAINLNPDTKPDPNPTNRTNPNTKTIFPLLHKKNAAIAKPQPEVNTQHDAKFYGYDFR